MRRRHTPMQGTQVGNAPRTELDIDFDIPSMPDAVCATYNDPELWFVNEATRPDEARLAIALCNTCPQIAQCLAYALDKDIDHGIWGGVTASDRNRAKRQAAWAKRQARFTGARRRAL